MLNIYLVPTRCVGIHTDRAAVYYTTQRVETAFPRGAWERESVVGADLSAQCE